MCIDFFFPLNKQRSLAIKLASTGRSDRFRAKAAHLRFDRVGSARICRRCRETPSTDFLRCDGTVPARMIMQLGARRGGGARTHARTVRAMCEASRGRQLRLIRAETDSGRNDGLLNTLTCRQPSAATSLPPHVAVRVVCDATEH